MVANNSKKHCRVNVGGMEVTVIAVEKTYPQFDTAVLDVEQQERKLTKYLDSPELVASHQFLPVVLRKKVFLKFFYDKNKGQLSFRRKVRPLVEVAHSDSLIFSLYATMLNEAYEKRVSILNLGNVATAYRRGRGSNIEASKEVIDQVYSSKQSWIIKSDFVGFFDHLNHRMVKQRVLELIGGEGDRLSSDWYAVITALTKYRDISADKLPSEMVKFAKTHNRYVNRIRDLDQAVTSGEIVTSKPHTVGIPQGTSMSAAIANAYMIPFDYALNTLAKAHGGIYRRYSDDFVVVLPKSLSLKSIKAIVKDIDALASRLARLNLEKKKTKILYYSHDTHSIKKVNDSSELSDSVFDYLGFVFDGRQVTLRAKGLFKFSHKSKHAVRQTAFEKNAIVQGQSFMYFPYLDAYHRLASQYLNMSDEAQTFRGYAARADQVYRTDNPGYLVGIDVQARKIVIKCQQYLGKRRRKYVLGSVSKHART